MTPSVTRKHDRVPKTAAAQEAELGTRDPADGDSSQLTYRGIIMAMHKSLFLVL